MRRSKRISAALLAIIAVILMCAPLVSYARVRTGEGEAELLQEGEFEIATAESIHRSASQSTIDTVANRVYSGLLNYSSRIDISQLGYSDDEIDAFYSNIINDNPDLFFVSSSYRYSYNPDTLKVTAIYPQYAMTESEVEEALSIFEAGVQRALKEVDFSMTDLQKALTLHDYICANAVYPDIFDENGNYVAALDLDIYHSAYGFFKDFNAVCAGYTLTFSYLMHRLGIECEYASSGDMEHAWNKIKLNGYWYNIDITYDNSDYIGGENTYGLAYHTCFLKSDAYFQSESGLYHYNYSAFDDSDAADETFDSYFWDDIDSRIYTVNGDYYYLDNLTNNYIQFKKRTLNGTETAIGSRYYSPIYNISRYAYDSAGVRHTIPHSDAILRILYLDGRFYCNDRNSIFSITTDGVKNNIVSDIGYTISIGEINGNIVYQTNDDMSTVIVLDKKEYFADSLIDYNNYPDINNDGFVNGRDWAGMINS